MEHAGCARGCCRGRASTRGRLRQGLRGRHRPARRTHERASPRSWRRSPKTPRDHRQLLLDEVLDLALAARAPDGGRGAGGAARTGPARRERGARAAPASERRRVQVLLNPADVDLVRSFLAGEPTPCDVHAPGRRDDRTGWLPHRDRANAKSTPPWRCAGAACSPIWDAPMSGSHPPEFERDVGEFMRAVQRASDRRVADARARTIDPRRRPGDGSRSASGSPSAVVA